MESFHPCQLFGVVTLSLGYDIIIKSFPIIPTSCFSEDLLQKDDGSESLLDSYFRRDWPECFVELSYSILLVLSRFDDVDVVVIHVQ